MNRLDDERNVPTMINILQKRYLNYVLDYIKEHSN